MILKKQQEFASGKYNRISDVPGVTVGHKTLSDKNIQTGVTIIQPTKNNIFKEKVVAASYVVNGFGKTSGLVQINELGVLESPIALTNTLSVGTVQQALVEYMLQQNDDIGDTTGTVNVVVGECNDGYLNDIRGLHVTKEDVKDALLDCKIEFLQGAIGAGTGMSCFQMKGGIGSASRVITIDEQEYIVGALVLSNFGLQKDFNYNSISLGNNNEDTLEKGSCIMIIATDVPLDTRQMQRVCKRMPVALANVGSKLGNGSGDIAIGFSTGNKIPHYPNKCNILFQKRLHDDKIDIVFRSAIEAMEESIISSMLYAKTTTGRNGNIRYSLLDTLKNTR